MPPVPPKTSFSVQDFNKSISASCQDTPCGISVVVNEDPCPDCCGGGGTQGPPGPPGPKGDPGEPGASSCPKIFAGPLLADPAEPIDPMAFEVMMDKKGYIVRLQLTGSAGNDYSTENYDASIFVTGPGEQGYIELGGAAAGVVQGAPSLTDNITNTIYPIAIKTVNNNDVPNYTNINTFRDFVKAKSLDDEDDIDFYFTGNNRYAIPTLLQGGMGPNSYSFICNDSSHTQSANGPYNLKSFEDFVSGVIGSIDEDTQEVTPGTVRYKDIETPNPPSVTNLGKNIITDDGEIGVAYDCENCIQPQGEQYKLTSAEDASNCDFFIDTENGVLYSKDSDDPTKFRENGIPLRRTPVIPELPNLFPTQEDICGIITSNFPISPYKWGYFCKKAKYDSATQKFVEEGADSFLAYNGAENKNDLDGIGQGQFDDFSNPEDNFQMLPIRVGTVVPIFKCGSTFMFSLPNAYKGCSANVGV